MSSNYSLLPEKLEAFLDTLKVFGEQNDVPNISKTFGLFLHNTIRLFRIKTILEVGCANGYSTLFLLDAVRIFNGKVVSIDHSTPSIAQARENIQKAQLQEFSETIEGKAEEIIPTLKTSFDLIFIDAEKKKYLEFWDMIQKNIHDTTLIIFDNVRKFPEKTQAFWEGMEKQIAYDTLEIPINDTDAFLMLWKKGN